MMEILPLIVRVIAAYVFLLILIRLSGKRTIRQGTPMDFVVALILGDMVDNFLWEEVGAAKFSTAILVVMGCHLLVAIAVCRSSFLAGWLHGREEPVIESASMVHRGMRRERLNLLEIFAELREQGVRDLREIKAADVELSGTISVLKEDWAREAQKQDKARLAGARKAPPAAE